MAGPEQCSGPAASAVSPRPASQTSGRLVRSSVVLTGSTSPPSLAPRKTGVLRLAECDINWRSWGDRGPAVVLVHGARAHAGWWAAVAGHLVEAGHRVIALDLSGHGDSGRRARYSPDLWADEVAAVIDEEAGSFATVVGHSMGGWVAIGCAARWPEQVRSLVLLDCSVRLPREGEEWAPRGMEERPLRRYRSREEAVEAFRLVPPQPAPPAVLRPIAETSVRPGPDGTWTWKFDPAMAQSFSDGAIRDYLRRLRCPIHLLYGTEDPLVSASTAEEIATMTGRPTPATAIEGAYHHALLDHPEAVAKALLATLTISGRHGRSAPGYAQYQRLIAWHPQGLRSRDERDLDDPAQIAAETLSSGTLPI